MIYHTRPMHIHRHSWRWANKLFWLKVNLIFHSFCFISICCVLFRFGPLRFVSFRFDLFLFVFICFVSICFVSICFVSFLFVSVTFRTLQVRTACHVWKRPEWNKSFFFFGSTVSKKKNLNLSLCIIQNMQSFSLSDRVGRLKYYVIRQYGLPFKYMYCVSRWVSLSAIRSYRKDKYAFLCQ